MYSSLLVQIPTEIPSDVPALLWVIVGILSAVIIYLYKTKESERKDCQKSKDELLLKMITGLGDVDESLGGVASLIESWQKQFETVQAIQELARRLDGHDKKGE